MDQSPQEDQTHPVEEVWIKAEPVDAEHSTYFHIKCEDGITIGESEPSTTTTTTDNFTIEYPEDGSIKSEEATFGDYECIPPSSESVPLQLTKRQTQTAKPIDKKFHCTECGAQFARNDYLEDHKRKHTGSEPFGCEECGVTFASKYLCKLHQEQSHSGEKPFGCDECGKTFFRKDVLAKHKRLHSGQRPYACDICGMRFAQKCHIKPHQRKHTGEKPFACEVCGMAFMYKSVLKHHRKMHPEGEKPSTSSVTATITNESSKPVSIKSEQFDDDISSDATPVQLVKSGKRTAPNHSTEKKFKCDQCDAKFARKHSLKIHERKHTGERPFGCDECGKTFFRKAILTKHKRYHSGEKPYACDICGMRFAQSGHVKPHKQTHTGERPFNCDECGTKFAYKSGLIQHKKLHLRDSIVCCSICKIKFGRKEYLERHMREKHC